MRPKGAAVFSRCGARFLVRGGRFEVVESTARPHTVVLEFKDYETAVACCRSAEYAAERALREGRPVADVLMVKGYDGPQPA